MFQSILLDSVILFLLIYALLDIFTHLAEMVSRYFLKEDKPKGYYTLLLEPQTSSVESQIRRAVRETKPNGTDIVLVDLGMAEEEQEIVQKLCKEYDFLKLFSMEQYFQFVEEKSCCSPWGN